MLGELNVLRTLRMMILFGLCLFAQECILCPFLYVLSSSASSRLHFRLLFSLLLSLVCLPIPLLPCPPFETGFHAPQADNKLAIWRRCPSATTDPHTSISHVLELCVTTSSLLFYLLFLYVCVSSFKKKKSPLLQVTVLPVK